MPQCPHCQTPYENGQRYCSACGSFLLHREKGDTFCPQCGLRVSPRQQFCHECDAPLTGEAPGQPPEPAPPAAPPEAPTPSQPFKALPPWVSGLLIGAGVAIIVLLILLFGRGTPPPPVAVTPAPGPAAGGPPPIPGTPGPPLAPAPELKGQLQQVLSTLREAQLHKNIEQFMSCYAKAFPNLQQKRQDALAAWANYDYTNLIYTIDGLKTLSPDNVVARVTWYIDVTNPNTKEITTYKQVYEVGFVKEAGQWHIRSLQEVG